MQMCQKECFLFKKEFSVILTTSFYDIESEDVYRKSLLPKFQLIPILHLIHDYVNWHCSIDNCVKLSLVDKTFCKELLSILRK